MQAVTENVLIQIILAISAISATIFGAIRYTIKSNVKREENLLKYFETKNGHMERMAKDFTNSSKDFAAAVKDLTVEIRVMSEKHKK